MKHRAWTWLATAVSMMAVGASAQGQDFSQVQIKTTPLGTNT
jgi:hypothetical protein